VRSIARASYSRLDNYIDGKRSWLKELRSERVGYWRVSRGRLTLSAPLHGIPQRCTEPQQPEDPSSAVENALSNRRRAPNSAAIAAIESTCGSRRKYNHQTFACGTAHLVVGSIVTKSLRLWSIVHLLSSAAVERSVGPLGDVPN
jgi:hypothetical protein